MHDRCLGSLYSLIGANETVKAMKTTNIIPPLLSRANRVLFAVFVTLLISVWGVLSLSFSIDEYRQLLYQATRESGFYEWLTVLAGLCITAVAFMHIRNTRKGVKHILPIPLLWLFAATGILGSLEEISWGQHIFGFESTGVFKEHNMQEETNLHNFVSQEYVNLLMQGSVYIVFIFLPILVYLNTRPFINLLPNYLLRLTPSLKTIGVFIISCSFQDYFRKETLVDTSLVWTVSFLYLISLAINSGKIKLEEWFVCVLLVITLLLTVICDPIFEYNNMQYEIRELFILIGFLFWFLEVGTQEKYNAIDKHQ